ncbi:keratin-associated protein 10-7-like [Dendronephthya gigantea]|uniref:keratin-associated protein 10-7-like n=1 Tax=Dendronephthya gigantea TaxID=151771 RepID=UPI00106D4BCB|nr:keratin-associated protein 10-7-like [Dendronephthya gigantea]
MSFVSMTFLFLLNAMLMGQFGLVLGQNTCNSNSDCVSSYYSNKVCCKGYAYQYGYTSRKCRYGISSCVGRYCTTDGDCGGKNECCKSNKCTTSGCSNCYSNSNCGFSEYCCKQRYSYDKHVCRRSCVGETCHSSLDCGGFSEYCNWNKKCALSTSCSSNSGCSGSTYCCKRGSYTNVCQSSCVGEKCSYDSDCGGPGESCDSRSKKCVECSTDGDCSGDKCCLNSTCVTSGCTRCSSNSGCSSSEYCCKRGSYYSSVCRKSCVGEKCSYDSDCGGPGESCDSSSKKCVKCSTDGDCSGSECCLKNKCVTSGCTPCSSNSGCSSSEYCCKRGIFDVNVCRKSCVGKTCSYDSDCGGPGESCNSSSKKCVECSTDGDCSGDKCCLNSKCVTSGCTRCSSDSGCSSSEYCCKRRSYFSSICRKSCVGETCFLDSDCGGPGERCHSNKCKRTYSSTTASWVVTAIVVGVILFFAVFGGIIIYRYRCFRGSSQRGRVVRQPAPQNAIAFVAVEGHTSAPPPPVCNTPPPPYYIQEGDFPSPQPSQFPPSEPLLFQEPQPPQY